MKTNFLHVARLAAQLTAVLSMVACSTTTQNRGSAPTSPASGAQSGTGMPFVGKFEVHTRTLKNGMKILVVRDDSSPTFAYQTWFKVGSRNELVDYTGLAHLFEHMMFRGTPKYPDGKFDRVLEQAGSEGTNAFTGWDYTAYVQELPSERLDLTMELEADRMVNLTVNEKSFTTEREVVQNERRYRTENDPEGLMFQELFGIAFTKHSYHWPIIGYEQDLARMSAKDAEAFYKKFYHPNFATLVIVGNVDPEQVFRLAERRYGSYSPSNETLPVPPAEPEQQSTRRKTLALAVEVEKILIGYRIPELTHADYPAISMLRAVLAQGRSSRLHRALVNTGIATSVEGYDLENIDPSLLVFSATLQKGKRAAVAESVITREIQRVMREPIAARELERARNQTNFDFYSSMDTSPGTARFLGRAETVFPGGYRQALEQHKKLMTVPASDLQRVAKQYLQAKNKTVIFGVPKP